MVGGEPVPGRLAGIHDVGQADKHRVGGVIKHRSSRETTMVGRGASLDGRLFLGGTDGSNPPPSSGESANFWFLSGGTVFLRYTYDEAEQQPWVSWYRGICGARNVMRRESMLDQPWRDEEAALLMVIAIHLHPLTARGERRQA